VKFDCALIGIGYWGSKLKKYIAESGLFNLKYACNSKSDLNEVWNDNTVTAIVNATPNEFHYEITKQALSHNKHVLTEKPLALTTADCLELEKLAKERNLKIQTNYIFNFSKALQVAQEWVEAGKIGELLGFEACVRHLGRFGGGSVYWLLGSHVLSVLDMFFPLQLLTFTQTPIVEHNGQIETGIINFHSLKGSKKLNGQIVASLNYPHKKLEIILYGETGTITYNPYSQPIPLHAMKYKRLKWTTSDKIPQKADMYISDESSNLRYTLETFHNVLTNRKESNLATAITITKILEDIQK